MQRVNFKKLSEVEFREQHHNKIPNRLAALENFNDSEDINMTWEHTKREYQNPNQTECSSVVG
jgi:hypothetical protein